MENTTTPCSYEQLPQEYHDHVLHNGVWTEEYSTAQILDFIQQLAVVAEHMQQQYNERAWGHWAMDRIMNINQCHMDQAIHGLSRLVALRTMYKYEPTLAEAEAK